MNIDRIVKETPINKVHFFPSINSTNSYLLEKGECSDVCISDTQSAGRGRRGNTWVSPKTGNLYFSLCWCFKEDTQYWSLLGLVTAIAITETLEEIGLRKHGIKWPNDIFWKDRKMGGVLIETLSQSGKVVIGIGLNLNMPEQYQKQIDQTVVSLDEAMQGTSFSREDLVIKLINRLYKYLSTYNNFDFSNFKKTWNRWDILSGRQVSIKHLNNSLVGKAHNIDSQGRLGFKEDHSNKIIYFLSAEIKLKPINTQ